MAISAKGRYRAATKQKDDNLLRSVNEEITINKSAHGFRTAGGRTALALGSSRATKRKMVQRATAGDHWCPACDERRLMLLDARHLRRPRLRRSVDRTRESDYRRQSIVVNHGNTCPLAYQ